MADFPDTIFTQRELENLPGIEYDADKKKVIFAEDLQALGDEITAIETVFNGLELGGTAAYLGLYLGALIISDIPSYLKHRDHSEYRSLGASGAVSAVVFASIVFSPWNSIYLFGAIRISAAIYAVLFVVYCVYMGKKKNPK